MEDALVFFQAEKGFNRDDQLADDDPTLEAPGLRRYGVVPAGDISSLEFWVIVTALGAGSFEHDVVRFFIGQGAGDSPTVGCLEFDFYVFSLMRYSPSSL